MPIKTKKRTIRTPEVIYRNNKPVSVIIDVDEYNNMLERLEDIEDLKFIENLKREKLKFKRLDDFLTEYNDKKAAE